MQAVLILITYFINSKLRGMENHLGNWQRSFGENGDLVLVVVLVAFGFWLLTGHSEILGLNPKPDAAAVATLVGALFGGAAILLGNWINRYNERKRAASDLRQRRTKLKALIAAELVDVFAGLIGTKELLDAALSTLNAGGHVDDQLDMTWIMPRNMPFTERLGVELLTLEQPAIDALVTLRSNLAITRKDMVAVTEGRERFGLLRITALSRGVAHGMAVLAKAFELIAPDRKLALQGQPPELAIAILNRMAGATD
ncbi:MAG TPA: hypothetical protein VMI10_10400 [Terriglobales bacterium]|nr:hypothetical protein [Terriglobales bacterium]